METCLQNYSLHSCNLYVSRKMMIASLIVTKLPVFTEHLAKPTAKFEYRLEWEFLFPV